ncbi:MAG TPA: cytochrome b/b6 domain-containing protein [Thiolinea sp.]|nr:cytochrome b/b6 domain-containing protein [Thiolinea sp.]
MNSAETAPLATTSRWATPTRWLHALVALTLTTQLVLSLLMVPPDELEGASALQQGAMEGHEVVGLVAAGVLLLHWLWLFMARSDIKFSNLFPWSPSGIKRILGELSYLFKHRKLPPVGEHGGLSGFVHGLGILIATLMAATGVGLYVVMDFLGGFENPLFEEIAEVHGLFGNLMWVYLILHALAAIWHEFMGERIFAGIRP